jgi:hypothetical protein
MPRKEPGLALPGMCVLAMTGGAVSTRQLTERRMSLRSAVESLMSSFFSAPSTRSRKTLWPVKRSPPSSWRRAVAASTRRASRSQVRGSSNFRRRCAGCRRGSSQFFLPRFLRSGLNPLRGVDELDLALAMVGLGVREHPGVSGDAGVVEELQRQGGDATDGLVSTFCLLPSSFTSQRHHRIHPRRAPRGQPAGD